MVRAEMADSGGEARMNAAAVRRVDPYAKEIVETSAHVALYSFDDNEWIKTDVEGALFVYERRGPPDHSVIVMNRLSTDNLIEPITDGLELQLQEPFLLYRNAQRRIYGLWFYDRDECARVADKIERLVERSKSKSTPRAVADKPDIFSMLTKAQDDYNENKRRDVASKSVMDFFAKAGVGAARMPMPMPVAAVPRALFDSPNPNADDPAILHRLMSDPVHSVEHIEKQQRSATPLDQDSNKRKPQQQQQQQQQQQKTPPKGGGGNAKQNGVQQRPTASTPRRSPPPASLSVARRKDDAPTSPTVAQKPALMPPTMFTSSAQKERAAVEPQGETDPKPEPLTRNQLLQALNYLIKNDADFMTKLHEAYVKSFSELVS